MCGLAGMVGLRGAKVSRRTVQAMSSEIAHRGPDGEGLFVSADSAVGFAHRRLAILGLGEAGAQPMKSADDATVLVYNGEIYNFSEIGAELARLGVQLRGSSDTEVLLEGYRMWGWRVVERLRGMFAFAIYDQHTRRVVLARDRLGIKPLYLALSGDVLNFCSELDPLRRATGASRLNRDSLALFLRYRYVPGLDSIWDGIERLAPGTAWEICLDDGQIHKHRYWSLVELGESTAQISPAASVCSDFRDRMDEVTALHMRSDVPVGLLLSGGLDSTTLLAVLRNRYPDSQISSFSVGFGTDRSELGVAGLCAREFSTEHHEIQVEAASLEGAIRELAQRYGEPLADSSAVPFLALAQAVSKHTKVVLGGDGGDELFWGYKWYQASHSLRNVPQLPGLQALSGLARGSPFLWRLMSALGNGGQARFDLLHGVGYTLAEVSQLLNGGARGALAPGYPERVDELRRGRIYDLLTFTVDSVLYKVDLASMAHGLEVRVPYLDHTLLEWALRLPREWLFQRGKTKQLLRTCMSGVLPAAVVAGGKQGFSLPLRRWSPEIGRLAKALLPSGVGVQAGLFNREIIDRMVAGRVPDAIPKLWPLLVLEEWLRARPGWS